MATAETSLAAQPGGRWRVTPGAGDSDCWRIKAEAVDFKLAFSLIGFKIFCPVTHFWKATAACRQRCHNKCYNFWCYNELFREEARR